MGTLTDNPSFTANEIYKIQETDPCEGAGEGASFGGIGVNNQPHQQLANRTAKNRADIITNTAAIAVLNTFKELFASLLAPNGYLKIGAQDANLGQIDIIIQWGFYAPPGGINGDTDCAVAWPMAFPTACLWAMAGATYKQNTTPDLGVGVETNPSTGALLVSKTGGTFFVNRFNVGGNIAGFTWLAIGY